MEPFLPVRKNKYVIYKIESSDEIIIRKQLIGKEQNKLKSEQPNFYPEIPLSDNDIYLGTIIGGSFIV